MKKNNIFMLIVGFFNFAICFCLLFLCVPDKVAISVSITEKITAVTSKWFLLINVFVPLILAILFCVFENQPKTKWFIKALFVLFIYENMLAFSYFSIENNYVIGELSQIPIAVSFFMPFSATITILALKLKYVPYNNKFGIKTKYSTKTEFIWKQTHFYASEIFFAYGVLSFLLSIVFVFVRLPYIQLIVLALGIIICFFITNSQSKVMYNKYVAMEKRKQSVIKNKG